MISRLRRALTAFVLVIVVSVATVSAAGLVWRNATSNGGAERVLRDNVAGEHLRVCGSPLASDAQLTTMARFRSTDMLLNGYFAHRNPATGKEVFDLLTRAGISYANAGENIGWNTYPVDMSASQAYQMFMSSQGHRALIQDCQFTRVGVGAYRVGAKSMFTVLFVRKP